MVSNISNEDTQSDQKYFSTYKSPNICIVPSASICYPPSPKKPKLENPSRANSPQNIDVSFLDDLDIDEIIKCLNDSDENAKNTTRTGDNENNARLEKDCLKSSYDNNNERIGLNYSIMGRDVSTKNTDNEKTGFFIENTHDCMSTNIPCIDKEVKEFATNCKENKHSEVHIDEDDSEMFVLSPIVKQPNDRTYNNIRDGKLNNITSSEILTNHQENINSQELGEKKLDKYLLHTEQALTSANEASKPFDGDGKMGSNTIMKNVDESKFCEKKCLQYSDDSEFQNKHNTTSILEFERTIDKLNKSLATGKKQPYNHDSSESFETKNLKIKNNSSDSINNNENKFKTQKNIEKKQVKSENENVDKLKPDMLIINNLENLMFQCLNKKYSMFSLIHSGKFSKIFKCKDSGGEEYAVKMLKKKDNGCIQEGVLSRIRGDIPKENLLCIYLIAGFSLNKNWCYLTDFYSKNLKDLLKESNKNLHIDKIQELAGQLVGAITILRNKNIVHSDINPSHILLDSTNSKLRVCGFDGAYYIETANLFPYKGTKCYRAPEVILGYSAGFSLDVWSTALVLHEMATGIQLFGGCIGDHVLYKQMCILGDVPPQMLLRSRYRNKYIIGYCFQKGRCLRHTNNFRVEGKNKIASTIHGAYFSHWTAGKTQKQISKDKQKIRQFISLLDQMLVMSPERRLPIEFAYSNPFIYKFLHH